MLGGASLSTESWGFPFEGKKMGFRCLLKGRVWGLITENQEN